MIVTGPSFNRSTFMSAPNTPAPTGRPRSSSIFFQERFVQRDGNLAFGGAEVRRPVAFDGGGVQGELAHHDNIPAGVLHRKVHHPVPVVEYPHPDDLSAQPGYVLPGVGILYPQQHEQSKAYFGGLHSVRRHRSAGYALNHSSHLFLVFYLCGNGFKRLIYGFSREKS